MLREKAFTIIMAHYSLHEVDLFHVRMSDITAVELVGFPVEAASERVAEPSCADLFHD